MLLVQGSHTLGEVLGDMQAFRGLHLQHGLFFSIILLAAVSGP